VDMLAGLASTNVIRLFFGEEKQKAGETSGTSHTKSVSKTLRAWRDASQPTCVRLERSIAQVRTALARTRADLASASATPQRVVMIAGSCSSNDNGVMTKAPLALLCQREHGLLSLVSQLQARLRLAQAAAEALDDKPRRTQQIGEALGRCRCVYQDAHILLHAPQPAVQEAFEAAICSPRAREGRLLGRWVGLFACSSRPAEPDCGARTNGVRGGRMATERSTGSSAAAGGLAFVSVPPPSVVLDFVVYLARLVVAQHSLQSLMPQVNVCTSRLLFHALQPTLWQASTMRNRARDERMLEQQRWMQGLLPEQLGVERRFLRVADHVSQLVSAVYAGGPAATTHAKGMTSPPLAARSVLSDFCFLSVPVDMLLIIYRAVGHVHTAAVDVAGVDHNDIGADSLLPLLVWTVVHTPLPHVFSALEYAKALCTQEQVTSELGYYLATFEAACEYVLDALPPSRTSTLDLVELEVAISVFGAEASSARPSPLLYAQELATAHPPSDDDPRMYESQRSVDATGPSPRVVLAKEVAERKALVDFLHQERAVDELVEALVL